MSEKFDCQKCGACCAVFHEEEQAENNYPLWGVAIAPDFKKVPISFVQIGKPLKVCDSQDDYDKGKFYTTNRFVRNDGLQCAALKGEIGKQTACTIYNNRPPVCRHFEVGSEKCLHARKVKNIK